MYRWDIYSRMIEECGKGKIHCYMHFDVKFTDKRYASLTSLNLICDHPKDYDLWIKMVGIAIWRLHVSSGGKSINCTYFSLVDVKG